MINIEIRPEYVAHIKGLLITNTFLTSLLTTFIVSVFAIIFYFNRKKRKSLLFNGIKVLIYNLLKLTETVVQDKKLARKILPLIATFFLFIVTANLLALFPGFLGSFFVKTAQGKIVLLRSPNSDLTTTLALALFSVISIQFFSLRVLGIKNYLARFFNFANPVNFFIGFFEILSEATKIFSFSFRLFGNILSGEVLLLIIGFLVPYIIPLPFMVLEIFVGIVQAFIFSALTLTFIKTSTIRHLTKI
ncbi:MAG TPA: F0F1 ATP synthase subunit A [Candidatus Parcubacteria bacterium]|nr:F0F1 ATP synthase subunit A [Candidatus Parcubacteria bacterium]